MTTGSLPESPDILPDLSPVLTLVPAVALDPACPPFCSVLFPPLPSSKYRLLPDTEIVPSWRRFPQQNKNFGNLTFAQDADGNWGYKVGGADPVIPFKQGGVKLLTSITGDGAINITSYVTTDYKKLTVDNFIVESYYFPKAQTVNTGGGNRSAGAALGATLSKSYDQSTGILTVSGLSQLACLMDNTTNVRASVIQKFSAKIYMVN